MTYEYVHRRTQNLFSSTPLQCNAQCIMLFHSGIIFSFTYSAMNLWVFSQEMSTKPIYAKPGSACQWIRT